MAEKLCQLKKKGGISGGEGSIPDYTYTEIVRNGNKTQSITCDIGDIIIVGTFSPTSQSSWNPTIVSGANLIEEQSYTQSGSTHITGLIAVATSTNVTIEWYGASANGKICIVHTNNLQGSIVSIEKNCNTAMASKNITNLKIGDVVVGNSGYTNNAANNIAMVVNGASLSENSYVGQAFIVTKDSANVVFSGSSSSSNTVVAFRQ